MSGVGVMYGTSGAELMQFGYDLMCKLEGKGEPVFLCIGSDKWVCDSMAVIVAEILKKEYSLDCYIYGGIDYNITADNLSEAVAYIETVHANSTIVVIDAGVGEDVGKVKLIGGCYPGMGKCLPIREVGVISILGVVERGGRDFRLGTTRLGCVVSLSRFIAKGCYLAVSKLKSKVQDKIC